MNPNPPEIQPEALPVAQPPVPPAPVSFNTTAAVLPATVPDPLTGSVVDFADVLMVLAVAFVGLVISNFVIGAIFVIRNGGRPPAVAALTSNVFFIIPVQLCGYAIAVASMLFLVSVRHRTNFWKGISWNAPSSSTDGAKWFGGGASLGLLSLVASNLLEPWIPKSLPINELFRTTSAAYVLSAFGILVAPLVEELFFRGFLYPALAKVTGVATSVVLTALGFALLHSEQLAKAWAPLMVLFVIGTVLTVVRARTQSVARCVLMHMGYNTMLFSAMFIATDGFRHMERM